MLRDVVVDRIDRDELLAVSQAPAIPGETMSLDITGGGRAMELRVRVLESRPVIVNGAVRHRIRLAVLEPATEVQLPDSSVASAAEAGAEAV